VEAAAVPADVPAIVPQIAPVGAHADRGPRPTVMPKLPAIEPQVAAVRANVPHAAADLAAILAYVDAIPEPRGGLRGHGDGAHHDEAEQEQDDALQSHGSIPVRVVGQTATQSRC
jgi:hypothetical protein